MKVEVDYSAKYASIAQDFAERVVARLGKTIQSITLFGSVARGEADPDSDIDVLVVVNPQTEETTRAVYDTVFDVEIDHGGAPLAVKVFGAGRFHQLIHLKTPFMTAILKEGRVLWPTKP